MSTMTTKELIDAFEHCKLSSDQYDAATLCAVYVAALAALNNEEENARQLEFERGMREADRTSFRRTLEANKLLRDYAAKVLDQECVDNNVDLRACRRIEAAIYNIGALSWQPDKPPKLPDNTTEWIPLDSHAEYWKGQTDYKCKHCGHLVRMPRPYCDACGRRAPEVDLPK